MGDYISRDVARDKLYTTCKSGRIIAVLLLLLALIYGAIVGITVAGVELPKVAQDLLYMAAPTLADERLAIGVFAAKAVILLLASIILILMFSKISRTEDAFRYGQMRQLRFVGFMLMLLGIVPTLAGNGVKIYDAIMAGEQPLAAIVIQPDTMCFLAGLIMFMAARALAAGANLGYEEDSYYDEGPEELNSEFEDMPDLSHPQTAMPLTSDAGSTAAAEPVPEQASDGPATMAMPQDGLDVLPDQL